MRIVVAMSALLAAATALAKEAPPPPPPPPQPLAAQPAGKTHAPPREALTPGPAPPELPPPPETANDAELEPQVTIVPRENEVVEEYRIHGQLYMVKVTPRLGPPYYLVDTNGDGMLDTRGNEISPELVVPRWMILRW